MLGGYDGRGAFQFVCATASSECERLSEIWYKFASSWFITAIGNPVL